MCLIAIAVDAHPEYKLIVAANRDEFYKRPTTPAQYWTDNPEILGGRDEQAGGTWMAISKTGRFSAVTNYRDLKNIKEEATSRGGLPINFINQNISPENYLNQVHQKSDDYNGFNLLCWADDEMYHYSNYEGTVNRVKPGIYGLSNALLDTPWPKVQKLKSTFTSTISKEVNHEELLMLLTDETQAPEEDLPDTGIGVDWEKMLSPVCIRSENYGTCCSTILTISKSGLVSFTEKTYPVGNRKAGTESFQFKI